MPRHVKNGFGMVLVPGAIDYAVRRPCGRSYWPEKEDMSPLKLHFFGNINNLRHLCAGVRSTAIQTKNGTPMGKDFSGRS